MTEEENIKIEHTNYVRALEGEITRLHNHVVASAAALVVAGIAIAEQYGTNDVQRVSIRRTIGAVVDELIDGLYPQAGDERDE